MAAVMSKANVAVGIRNCTFLHLNSVRIFFGRLTLLWAHLDGTVSKLFLKRSSTKTLVRWP